MIESLPASFGSMSLVAKMPSKRGGRQCVFVYSATSYLPDRAFFKPATALFLLLLVNMLSSEYVEYVSGSIRCGTDAGSQTALGGDMMSRLKSLTALLSLGLHRRLEQDPRNTCTRKTAF